MPHPVPSRFRVAILGGGITGLTAAYALSRAREDGAPLEEFLIEGGGRLGGMIQTERVDGFLLEAGPDSFLTEKPEAIALCEELGLANELIGSNDAIRRTYILCHGRLVPLPEGLLLFIPMRLWPALRSPLFPLASKLAILREALLSRPDRKLNQAGNESVAHFVRRRFGGGVLENIAEPLLAGIYGGEPERLSLRSVLPRLYGLEQRDGGSTRGGLRKRTKDNDQASRPLFTTLRGGMDQLTEALMARLGWNGSSGCPRLHLGHKAEAIKVNGPRSLSSPDSSPLPYTIRCEGGMSFEADSVILCLPACECSRPLARVGSNLGPDLAAIPYTPAVTVALGYRSFRTRLPPGFGFLAPRKAGRHLLACTFVHMKFAARAPQGSALLRCFLGGARNPEVMALSDRDLIAMVTGELRTILSLSENPTFHRIYRWPSAMPQYLVGHEERVRRIQQQVNKLPGLFLAGSAYSGVGISDCIRSAKCAADAALNFCRQRET